MKSDIEKYCVEHSEKESEILRHIKEYTFQNEKYPQMICGPLVGNTLCSFIRAINAEKILDVGMFTGYSAMTMAQALSEKGEIHTCEYMEEHIITANKLFSDSQLKDRIIIHQGLAIDILESFKANSFDFAFIDADKINYMNYYIRCMQLVRAKGIIILDNMLWSGSVIEPKDEDAKKLREVGDYIQQDDRVINMLLPIRDGLMVCYKK